MNRTVAVIGARDSRQRADELTAALQACGIQPLLCPDCDNRGLLRWTMDLLPADVALAVFVDNDNRLTASHAAALDPAIIAVSWRAPMHESSQFPLATTDCPVLVSFAREASSLAQLIAPWLAIPDSSALATNEAEHENIPAMDVVQKGIPSVENAIAPLILPAENEKPLPAHNIANGTSEQGRIAPPTTASGPALSSFDDRDKAVLKELERQMASALVTKVKNEPVQIQQPGLDFSVALRGLMTAGRSLAQKNSHPEVLGAHYLTALDEPWRSALAERGLTPRMALDYLSGLDSAEKITAEPVISDEVFEAVSRAKQHARDKKHPCVKICDFLNGLLRDDSGSMADLLSQLQISAENLLKAISEADPGDEPCGEPFFKPSSMDQAGFYEFDASEVRNLTERLRELPAFQKAAERVAESRSRQGHSPFDDLEVDSKPGVSLHPISNQIPIPPPPPEKPEILRVHGEFPPVDVVENMADLLLEGQIIAFPIDVMLATAVDAANRMAVDNLREATGLSADRPLSVLINSTSQLKHMIREDVDALEPLLDEFWPGPLTLIFNAATGAVKHLSGSGTIAVRQPADNVSLAILSMLGRPLAVTSWDRDISALAGHAAAVIESGQPAANIRTTVVDLSIRPWQIIREGAIPGQAVMRFYQPRQ